MFLTSPLAVLNLLLWSVLWTVGGIWLVRAAFRLQANEQVLVGFAVGWLVQTWLANLLVWIVPVPAAFWVSAVLIFLGGLLAALREGWRGLFRWPLVPFQLFALFAIVMVFFSISRGMAIFDDFAHLPTVSIMAAGDIPPHFSLDPNVVYGYHHFLLLFQAQAMRIGGLTPWAALDAGRSLSLGVAVLLAFLFGRRLTHSYLAGLLSGLVVAFGSGTRWLLLLLPRALVLRIGRDVHLIGSGAGSGPTLGEALLNAWAVEGAGPMPFPFAFANGIYPAGVIAAHSANGLLTFANIFLLLLTFHRWRAEARWRSWLAALLSIILISIWGLLGEAELAAMLAGWSLVAFFYAVSRRTLRLPASLWRWLGIVAAGCAVGFLEGGAWTDILRKALERITTGEVSASYQSIGFQAASPAVVSSHLGPLSLLDPAQLLLALLELGPVLLVLPLLIVFGLKAFRLGRWYEAAMAAAALVSLFLVFVQFTGSTGVRNTPRLYFFIPLCTVFAVPLIWMWASRRSPGLKGLAAGLGLILVTGGFVMFGIQLLAIQQPVYSYYITPLDARMASAYWDRLAPGALVFDPDPYRAPALFGRPTNSHLTWYAAKPEWEALVQSPDPRNLRKAGFSYLYLDNSYWDSLDLAQQQALSDSCVRLLEQVEDNQGGSRRLLDVRGCP